MERLSRREMHYNAISETSASPDWPLFLFDTSFGNLGRFQHGTPFLKPRLMSVVLFELAFSLFSYLFQPDDCVSHVVG